MTTIRAFVKSHPLLSYFALTFAISWGGVLIVVGGPAGLPATQEQFEMLLPIGSLAMFAGPSVAGIVLIGLLHGRAGLRDLLTRMTRWRVDARWWAVALLTAPLLATAVLLALSLISPEFLPVIFTSDEKATLLLMGIAIALGTGIFEELGWTAFAIPTLLRLRYGVLSTGLIVGMLWAAWHFIVNAWLSDIYSGALSLAAFLPLYLFSGVVQLPAFRVLMVWVYDRSGESLLLAMLMHASLTVSTVFILVPSVTTGVPFLTYMLVLAAALWLVVAVVAVANHGHLTRQPPLRRRVA